MNENEELVDPDNETLDKINNIIREFPISDLNEVSIIFDELLSGELTIKDACSKEIPRTVLTKVNFHKKSLTNL